MSIQVVEDPGFESPLRVTFQVTATGSTDAADQAKREAREAGYKVKTLGWISLADPADHQRIDVHREPTEWRVQLIVRPVAP